MKSAQIRILVIGLRAEQARMLQKLFKGFKIDFISDQKPHYRQLGSNLAVYEKIIVATKFTSHSTHNTCKKFSSYQMVAGGFSSVKSLLGAMV